MTTMEYPGNPWEDSEVVWLSAVESLRERFDTFRRLAANPERTHLVRQIKTNSETLFHTMPQTQGEAEDLVALTDSELDRLSSHSVEVARPEWHIIGLDEVSIFPQFDPRFLPILARVPIVDGQYADGGDSHLPPGVASWLKGVTTEYVNETPRGEPYLYDHSRANQYMYGRRRIDDISTPAQPIAIDPDIFIRINNGSFITID